MEGKFITVEGLDGAGKSTNLDFMQRILIDHDVPQVLVTREPGGTRLGEELRRLLLAGHDLHIDAMAELLMIFASRAQHLAERIAPALKSGTWVLCDRFTDATYAYQCGGRDLARNHVMQLESMVQGGFTPDLTVLLDIEPGAGRARSGGRDRPPDRFESEQDGFRRRVREAYLELARRHPHRISVVDAGVDLPAVQAQIREVLLSFLERCR